MKQLGRFIVGAVSYLTLLQLSAYRCEATLVHFTDYNLEGVSGSWDIFYGANYLPVFEFPTGTTGNPMLDSTSELVLRATVTTWVAGSPAPFRQQATGPIGSDSAIPGDRESFYTFFAGNINWDISGTAAAAWDTVILQARIDGGSNSSMTNIRFNSLAATTSFDVGTGVGTWRWNGLSVSPGDAYGFTWQSGTHTGFDAFQVQMGVVPEPATWALLGLGVAIVMLRRNRGLLKR